MGFQARACFSFGGVSMAPAEIGFALRIRPPARRIIYLVGTLSLTSTLSMHQVVLSAPILELRMTRSNVTPTRRTFLKASFAGIPAVMLAHAGATKKDVPIRVVVWDEQQPAQKQAYEDFLGNEI